MPLVFRLLGPLEVERDGCPVPLGGPRERAVLALLLLRANEVVARDTLIDELWATPPGGAQHALETRISSLRRRLGETVIETRPGGYLLRTTPDRVDLLRFEALVSEGRQALAGGDVRRASELLATAVSCWRGPALADIAFEQAGLLARGRLEEERLAALEDLAEARLAMGRQHELVAELEARVAAQPLRERSRAQLMLALYRDGRQAEALEAYRQGRRMLVEELGIEPGRELEELQGAILRHDPGLDAPGTPPVTPTPPQAAPREPAPPRDAVEVLEERKVVSVLFCDLVDSASTPQRTDPEDVKARLRPYHERVRNLVERHGGVLLTRVGDAVVAVFGAPVAHEDDAERAVRTGLRILEEIAGLSDAEPRLEVRGRIGIDTGEAVVSLQARPEAGDDLVTGSVVTIAWGLQQAAPIGAVVISDETYRRTSRLFDCERLQPVAVTGRAEPVACWRALRRVPTSGRA